MNDTTFQGNGKIAYVPVVVNDKPPKQSNYDRIRAMSVEEMAELMGDVQTWGGCPNHGARNCKQDCADCWLDWLKQEGE